MAISLRGQEATTERRIFEDIKTKRTYFLLVFQGTQRQKEHI